MEIISFTGIIGLVLQDYRIFLHYNSIDFQGLKINIYMDTDNEHRRKLDMLENIVYNLLVVILRQNER